MILMSSNCVFYAVEINPDFASEHQEVLFCIKHNEEEHFLERLPNAALVCEEIATKMINNGCYVSFESSTLVPLKSGVPL